MLYIVFRIVIGVLFGMLAVKFSKNKNYEESTAFLLGFLLPYLGPAIVYFSKDKVVESHDEEDELSLLIDRLEREKE